MKEALTGPTADQFEEVPCYLCGTDSTTPFIEAEDDLGGKPGRFHFVRCKTCGLTYQSPRLRFEHIGTYYDDEYIAHRKKNSTPPLARVT